MQSTRSLWRLTAAVFLVVLVTAWSLTLLYSRDVRQKNHAEAGQHMEAMAEAYAMHAQMSLAVADETLQRLQETLKNDGEAAFARMARVISRADAIGGGIDRVVLVGPDGRTDTSYVNGEKIGAVDVSDREYFKAFRTDPTDRIFVTEPIVGKTSGKWIILFARPVLADSRFAGVIFVGLEAHNLSGLVKTAENNGVLITLLSPGQRIVARSLAPAGVIGKRVEVPAQDSKNGGAAPTISPIDGVARLTAVHSVPGWGMRVLAGIDLGKLENEISARNRTAIVPAVLLTLLLIPALLLMRRAVRAQQVAERARQREATRSRKVLESMAEGVLLIEPNGRVSFANDAAQGWLTEPVGHPFQAALRTSGLALVTEDGMPFAMPDPLEHFCLQSGLNLENAWLLDSTSQQEKWLALQARPLFDDENRVSGAIATIVDRSDEHERIAEAELSRTILARMNDAVLITDITSRILSVNAAFLQMTGYGEAELLGRKPALLKSNRHDDTFWSAAWSELTREGQWSGKIWNCRKDGSELCVWNTITAVRDRQGKTIRYVAVSRDITEQQAQEADLWRRANFDSLTGLANRTRFNDRLTQLLSNSARHEQSFALCYLDLDRFKPVNDTLGHSAGDALLRQVAQRLLAIIRRDDTVARIGGDEFALLMPYLKTSESACRIAEKIIAEINRPFALDEGTAGIGISIGIALYPQHGEDAASLIASADRALYRAKAEGRNVWRWPEDSEAEKTHTSQA